MKTIPAKAQVKPFLQSCLVPFFFVPFSFVPFCLLYSCKNQQLKSAPASNQNPEQPVPVVQQNAPVAAPQNQPMPKTEESFDYGIGGDYVLLKKGTGKTYAQLDSLTLFLISGNKMIDTITGVVSGTGSKQEYLTQGAPGPAGSNRPIPEGQYRLLRPVRDGKSAIGPWWIAIMPHPHPRKDLGAHLDANRKDAPGTAGCVGMPDMEKLNQFMTWMERPTPPNDLVVDWGLGTVGGAGAKLTSLTLTSHPELTPEFLNQQFEESQARRAAVPDGEVLN